LIYLILAELVIAIHFLFIAFNVLGGLLAIWKKWIPFIHIPAVIWGTSIIILGGTCPLTPLEKFLRKMGGAEGYSGGFIGHYITPIIYPGGVTREIQIILGITAIIINILIYSYVIYRRRSKII